MRNIKIGVEIEFFGVSYNRVVNALTQKGIEVAYMGYTHAVTNGWKLVTDISVTNRGTNVGKGLELVSPILYGDEGLDELEVVMSTLNSIGAKVDKTCGLHVHHDISDYDAKNLLYLYRLYFNYSKGIDSILPPSRRGSAGNYYCKALKKSEVKNFEYCRTPRDFYYESSSRYVTLNCKSYIKYGTIEFRQHSGTIEFEKAEAWIILTHCMVNYCKYNTVALNYSRGGSLEQLLKLLNLNNSYAGNYLEERKRILCA